MIKNKKMAIMGITAIAALTVLAGGAVATAYLTDTKDATNSITVGHDTHQIVEDFDPPASLSVGNNYYQKTIQVENTGTVDDYVRVFMEFSDSRIRDVSGLSSDGNDASTAVYYAANKLGMSAEDAEKTGINKEPYINKLPEGWVYVPGDDDGIDEADSLLGGYYYYNKVLKPGEKTTPLAAFVNTYFEKAEDVTEYDIIVYSESVQSRDKDGGLDFKASIDDGTVLESDPGYVKAWKEFLSGKSSTP